MPDERVHKGWKDIAAFLGTSDRSAIRWMKELGLPVQRVGTRRGASVFACERDLREWLETVGTRLHETEEIRDEAVRPEISMEEPIAATTPWFRRGITWLISLLVIIAGVGWLTALISRPTSASAPTDAARPSPRIQRAVALRIALPGTAAAGLVLTDGKRSTIAMAGRPVIQLDAKIGTDRMTLDIIGPGSDGKDRVLFSTELSPGTRIAIKRPYAFELEWPAPERPRGGVGSSS